MDSVVFEHLPSKHAAFFCRMYYINLSESREKAYGFGASVVERDTQKKLYLSVLHNVQMTS